MLYGREKDAYEAGKNGNYFIPTTSGEKRAYEMGSNEGSNP